MARFLIGGEFISADGRKTLEIYNPATGEVVDTVPQATEADAEAAVQAAQAAFRGWWATPASRRGEILFAGADRIAEAEEELAHSLTSEQGKPLSEARMEIRRFVHTLRHYAGLAKNLRGAYVPSR